MNQLLLFVIALTILCAGARSQGDPAVKRIAFGLQGGVVRATNESGWGGHQQLSPALCLYSLFRNGVAPGVSPEFNLGYVVNESDDNHSYAYYSTTAFTGDVRLRWYPLAQDAILSPYISAGLGLVIPKNKLPTIVSDPSFRRDNATTCFPISGGITHDLSDNISLDINTGWVLTVSDDINPLHDGGSDGWFMAKVGLTYSVGPVSVDSDDDGLSDHQEQLLGTDRLKADTDGDGIRDGDEVNTFKTDPLNRDTDDGGVDDGREVDSKTSPVDFADDILSIGVGETLQIRNIEYSVIDSVITKRSERILFNVVELMQKRNTSMELVLAGHTDNAGARELNMVFSTTRASGVREWLISKGVSAARLIAQGYGSDRPVATNETAEGKRRNRRIEFKRTK